MKRLKYSRRSFLKTTSSALVAAPLIVPSSVFGNEAAPPPSERVNLGHIGVGWRGTDVLKTFLELPQARSVAVCDLFKSRRDERAKLIQDHYAVEKKDGDYKGCAAYADFRELLARPDIDAVVIATPDHWHVPIAIEAVRAGKDVYVEKPLGLTLAEGQALRAMVKRYGAVFQYGTQQRSEKRFRFACELALNGYVGKLHTLHVWAPEGGIGGSMAPIAPPEDLDYDFWLGPAPQTPYTADRCTNVGGYFIYDNSIGYIAGWGVHPLDIAQWGHNLDTTVPVEYEGIGNIPTDGLYSVINSWDATMRYADGVSMRFVSADRARDLVASYRPAQNHGTTFIGDKGWVSVDRGGIFADPVSLLETKFTEKDMSLHLSENHSQDFLNAILSRQSTISPIDAAVRDETISHLCDIAIRHGRKMRWDPVKEEILDDPDAARMLSRPMRSPWTL